MKFINPRIHGVIDSIVVVFLLASPMLFGFTSGISFFTYVLALVHMALTLLTDFSSGIKKIIPFPMHGIIEFIVGIILLILAFTAFRDSERGKEFYIYFGSAILLTWLFTNYHGSTRTRKYSR